MKIDVNKIRRLGKTEESFSFLYMPNNEIIDLPDAEFEKEAEVKGTVYLSDDGNAFVKGEITFYLVGECSRCLKQAKATVSIPFEENYTKLGDDGSYPILRGTVDLTKAVDDNIIMNMPMKLLCSSDCEGISYKSE